MMQIHPPADLSSLAPLSTNVYTVRDDSIGEVAKDETVLLGPFSTLADGFTDMHINLRSLKGDADLYVGKNRVPTTSSKDCSSSKTEAVVDRCTIADLVPGDSIYVLIKGDASYVRGFGAKSKYQVQIGAKEVSKYFECWSLNMKSYEMCLNRRRFVNIYAEIVVNLCLQIESLNA